MDAPLCYDRTLVTNAICLYLPPKILDYPLTPLPPANGYNPPYILTGHWLLMDAMGIGLCVAFIAFVRLPSLKVSTLLLSGLLLYDVFWVFFSKYFFNANVMVRVATR